MGFQEKFKETVSKGLEQSKHILSAAKDKAKELGDSGILRLEIRQLEDKVKKAETALGHAVHDTLSVEGKQSVTKKSAPVKELLEKLDDLHTQITAKRIVLADLEEKEAASEAGAGGGTGKAARARTVKKAEPAEEPKQEKNSAE